MSNQKQAGGGPLGKIKIGNAIYPILIGLAVVGWMLWRDFNPEVFADIRFSWATVGWLCLAVFFMFGRDIGYIIRIRVLSGGQLSWLQSFRVIMLWEFTSAITPSAVGGTSVAIIYVHKEGISLGRSSAIVMLTSFLDEIYFIVMFPLLMLLVGVDRLFDITAHAGIVARGLMTFALVGYFLKLAFVCVLSYGLFVNPRGLKWMLLKIFKLRWLHRWYRAVERVGTDIVLSSHEIKRAGMEILVESLLFDFPVLEFAVSGSQCADYGLLLGQRPVPALCPATGDVDHDAGDAYSRRQRIRRIHLFDLLPRPDRGASGDAARCGNVDRGAVAVGDVLSLPGGGCDHLPALDQTEIRQQQVVNGPVPTCLRYRNALLNRLFMCCKGA